MLENFLDEFFLFPKVRYFMIKIVNLFLSDKTFEQSSHLTLVFFSSQARVNDC